MQCLQLDFGMYTFVCISKPKALLREHKALSKNVGFSSENMRVLPESGEGHRTENEKSSLYHESEYSPEILSFQFSTNPGF